MITEYILKKGAKFCGVPHSILHDGLEIWTGGKSREFYETGEYEILSDADYQKKVDDFVSDFTGNWTEITKERYDDQLNVLPPVKWFDGGFFISEAYTLNVHPFYQAYNGKYYEAYFALNKPRQEIRKSLVEFVANEQFEIVKAANINRLKKDMMP